MIRSLMSILILTLCLSHCSANKFVLDAVIGAALYGIYESNDDNN